jgi:hypothetical protein
MRQITGIRRLDETIIRLGGHGDNWHMSWADNNKQYVSLCDGAGLPGTPQQSYNSRLYAVIGDPPAVTFEYLPNYPFFAPPPGGARYYSFGTFALDGKIYQFLSLYQEGKGIFYGAKLIFSPDNGQTWHNQDGTTPVRWERVEEQSKDNMVFFCEPNDSFSFLSVLQMGRNYESNTDGYVYVYAPNGNTDGSMNQLVMFRAPKDRLLDRGAYEFFVPADSKGKSKWVKDIEERGVAHTFPTGWVNRNKHPYAWHPCVVYLAARGCYLMANWGMGCSDDGTWFGKPSYLGFWTSPHPWGPWTQIHEDSSWTPGGDDKARCYQPQIAPRWIAEDGNSFWLVWTDFQTDAEKRRPYYAFNIQKAEIL